MSCNNTNLTPNEIQLIRDTHLFFGLKQADFYALIKTSQKVYFKEKTLVIKEGEKANALYIILSGSVGVFVYDTYFKKVPVARLNKGDFFGEQAILSKVNKTRNANVEALSDLWLIEINKRALIHFLSEDKTLQSKLKKIEYVHAIKALSLSIDFYKGLSQVVSDLKDPKILDFKENDLIFNFGDRALDAYIILKGKVKLLIPDKNTNHLNEIFLHKGHLFGELGVLNQQPRKATAIAMKETRLLAIAGDYFKEILGRSKPLRQLIARLKYTYELPSRGTVKQYLGKVGDFGEALTNMYKMQDGRSLISSLLMDKNIFTLSVIDEEGGKAYQYKKNRIITEIYVKNNRLIKIKAKGLATEVLPQLCLMLFENQLIEETSCQDFVNSGKIYSKIHTLLPIKTEMGCLCMQVSKAVLEEQIALGVNSLEQLSKKTGACTVCMGCRPNILKILGKNLWLPAIMKKAIVHNNNIVSYSLQPEKGYFQAVKPGQHVIIQIKIEDQWIERPYTVSSFDGMNIVITIKKQEHGFFTSWLFDNNRDVISINVSQPQGNFFLNKDPQIPVICFAGGIGITPFIAFARQLEKNNLPKTLLLLYSVVFEDNFIFKEELDELSHKSVLQIKYRASDKEGLLGESEVLQLVRSIEDPEVYLCGPQGFIAVIQNSLKKINFNPEKIHVEVFVHAGELNK